MLFRRLLATFSGKLFFFITLFLTFFYFYFHILINGYHTDVPTHLMLSVLYSEGMYSLPHMLFAKVTLPLFNIFDYLHVDILFTKLAHVSTIKMKYEFGRQLFKLHQRIPFAIDGSSLNTVGDSSLLNLYLSSISILAFLVVMIFLSVFTILKRFLTPKYNEDFILLLTAILMFVTAVYAPFFNKDVYLGQGSPNIWHNPTILMVKPLSLIFFMQFVLFTEKKQYQESIGSILLLCLLITLSVLAKPNFALAFIPAMPLYFFFSRLKCKEPVLYVKSFLVISPVLFILLYQYIVYKEKGSGVIIDFLGVWRLYTPNVLISIVLATAFPLAILVFRFRNIVRDNNYLMMAWFLMISSILQAALFAEQGFRYADANFMWGYNLSLQIVFIFSLIELLNWIWSKSHYPGNNRHGLAIYAMAGTLKSFMWGGSKSDNLKISLAISLLCLHLISGMYYFLKIFRGGGYR